MSGSACPETPRQKMIGMMYLVLTAMLAMNVAEEVLLAFKGIDISLQQTIANFELKNQQVYTAFRLAKEDNPAKADSLYQIAMEVKKRSDEVNDFIRNVKVELVKRSGTVKIDYKAGVFLKPNEAYVLDLNGDTLLLRKQDDLNTPPELMLTLGRGKELKETLIQYREYLLGNINERNQSLKKTIELNLDTSDPKVNLKEGDDHHTWLSSHFEHKPAIAVITELSKMQIDIRNTEANVVGYLFGQIDASSFKFTGLEAKIVPKSSYVLKGGQFEAEIFLTAIDETMQPEVFVGGQKVKVVNGKAQYKLKTSQLGKRDLKGFIRYPNPMGGTRDYPFETSYEVAQPSFSIAPTKMNVFYMGVPNPIDISVAGVSMRDVETVMTNGKIVEKGGKLFVYPSKEDAAGKKTKISIYATIDGNRRFMGDMDWRVKRVPDPVAKIGGKKGGRIRKEELMVQEGIAAVLEDFDFDMKFKVSSFEMVIIGAGGFSDKWSTQGNRFTPEQKRKMKRLTSGTDIYFRNIMAKGDDGTTRELSSVALRVK